jgi:hypothetical protein
VISLSLANFLIAKIRPREDKIEFCGKPAQKRIFAPNFDARRGAQVGSILISSHHLVHKSNALADLLQRTSASIKSCQWSVVSSQLFIRLNLSSTHNGQLTMNYGQLLVHRLA